MKTIEEKANSVALEIANEDGLQVYAIDPFTILMIISLIVSIIRLYLECSKSPEDMLDNMKSPNLIQRWRLKHLIRDKIDDEEVHKLLAKPVFNNLLSLGHKLSINEVKSMTREVQ